MTTGLVKCSNPKRCYCNGRRYTCRRCKRFVPECYGSTPEPECDACWGAMIGEGLVAFFEGLRAA